MLAIGKFGVYVLPAILFSLLLIGCQGLQQTVLPTTTPPSDPSLNAINHIVLDRKSVV